MFKKLKFSISRIYPTLVVSTMSSGKSTLINALIGKELLPSQNGVCTAKALAILDNDRMEDFRIHAVDKEEKYILIENATQKAVSEFNRNNDFEEMILEGQIKGIKNSEKSLFLVDTPGINNSMEQSHEMITREVLNEYSEGLILYVINAQQIATYDDNNFLTYVAQKLKDNNNFNIIFVINKMDLIDPERESLYELIQNCKHYIESKGIEKPVLIPVSASSALLFKKVLNGENLSMFEEKNFIRNYEHFKRQGFTLVDYVSLPKVGGMQDLFEVDGNKYTRADIISALYNTGLTILENAIDETLVYSLKMSAPQISFWRTEEKNLIREKKVTHKRVAKKKRKRK